MAKRSRLITAAEARLVKAAIRERELAPVNDAEYRHAFFVYDRAVAAVVKERRKWIPADEVMAKLNALPLPKAKR